MPVERAKLMRSPRMRPLILVCRNAFSTRFQSSGGTSREPSARARMRSASIPGGAWSAMARRTLRRWRRYVEVRCDAGFPRVAGGVAKFLRSGGPGACAPGMSISMSLEAGGCGVVLPSDKSGSPTQASAWSDTPGRRRSVLDGGSRFDAAVCGGVPGAPCSAGGAQVGEDGRYGAEGDWGRGGDGSVDPESGGRAA